DARLEPHNLERRNPEPSKLEPCKPEPCKPGACSQREPRRNARRQRRQLTCDNKGAPNRHGITSPTGASTCYLYQSGAANARAQQKEQPVTAVTAPTVSGCQPAGQSRAEGPASTNDVDPP